MIRFHKKKWSVPLNKNTHACSIFVCIVIKIQGLVQISNCILIINTFSFCRSSNCKKRFMAGKFWHAFCVNYGMAYRAVTIRDMKPKSRHSDPRSCVAV